MFVLALFALPVCISDWRYRRIPNIYLVYMLYPIFAIRLFVVVQSIAVISCAAFFAALLTRIGMGAGDAKLFGIIALALNLPNFGALSLLTTAMYLVAILQVLLMWLFSTEFPRSIPLAPAIFLGSVLYLAASMSPSLRQYADALVNSW